jgi:hypothetical protein
VALLAVVWLGWTRVGYSLLVARGETALARDDYPAALKAFERARELRPDASLARELATHVLSESALRRAEEGARLGNLDALRLELGRAIELGAQGPRLQTLRSIAAAATKMAEARRLTDSRRYARARALLDLVPGGMSEPWETRASSLKSIVDAELDVAARLLKVAEMRIAKPDPQALAVAAAVLTEFLERFPDHPRRAEAVLLRARSMSRINASP